MLHVENVRIGQPFVALLPPPVFAPSAQWRWIRGKETVHDKAAAPIQTLYISCAQPHADGDVYEFQLRIKDEWSTVYIVQLRFSLASCMLALTAPLEGVPSVRLPAVDSDARDPSDYETRMVHFALAYAATDSKDRPLMLAQLNRKLQAAYQALSVATNGVHAEALMDSLFERWPAAALSLLLLRRKSFFKFTASGFTFRGGGGGGGGDEQELNLQTAAYPAGPVSDWLYFPRPYDSWNQVVEALEYHQAPDWPLLLAALLPDSVDLQVRGSTATRPGVYSLQRKDAKTGAWYTTRALEFHIVDSDIWALSEWLRGGPSAIKWDMDLLTQHVDFAEQRQGGNEIYHLTLKHGSVALSLLEVEHRGGAAAKKKTVESFGAVLEAEHRYTRDPQSRTTWYLAPVVSTNVDLGPYAITDPDHGKWANVPKRLTRLRYFLEQMVAYVNNDYRVPPTPYFTHAFDRPAAVGESLVVDVQALWEMLQKRSAEIGFDGATQEIAFSILAFEENRNVSPLADADNQRPYTNPPPSDYVRTGGISEAFRAFLFDAKKQSGTLPEYSVGDEKKEWGGGFLAGVGTTDAGTIIAGTYPDVVFPTASSNPPVDRRLAHVFVVVIRPAKGVKDTPVPVESTTTTTAATTVPAAEAPAQRQQLNSQDLQFLHQLRREHVPVLAGWQSQPQKFAWILPCAKNRVRAYHVAQQLIAQRKLDDSHTYNWPTETLRGIEDYFLYPLAGGPDAVFLYNGHQALALFPSVYEPPQLLYSNESTLRFSWLKRVYNSMRESRGATDMERALCSLLLEDKEAFVIMRLWRDRPRLALLDMERFVSSRVLIDALCGVSRAPDDAKLELELLTDFSEIYTNGRRRLFSPLQIQEIRVEQRLAPIRAAIQLYWGAKSGASHIGIFQVIEAIQDALRAQSRLAERVHQFQWGNELRNNFQLYDQCLTILRNQGASNADERPFQGIYPLYALLLIQYNTQRLQQILLAEKPNESWPKDVTDPFTLALQGQNENWAKIDKERRRQEDWFIAEYATLLQDFASSSRLFLWPERWSGELNSYWKVVPGQRPQNLNANITKIHQELTEARDRAASQAQKIVELEAAAPALTANTDSLREEFDKLAAEWRAQRNSVEAAPSVLKQQLDRLLEELEQKKIEALVRFQAAINEASDAYESEKRKARTRILQQQPNATVDVSRWKQYRDDIDRAVYTSVFNQTTRVLIDQWRNVLQRIQLARSAVTSAPSTVPLLPAISIVPSTALRPLSVPPSPSVPELLTPAQVVAKYVISQRPPFPDIAPPSPSADQNIQRLYNLLSHIKRVPAIQDAIEKDKDCKAALTSVLDALSQNSVLTQLAVDNLFTTFQNMWTTNSEAVVQFLQSFCNPNAPLGTLAAAPLLYSEKSRRMALYTWILLKALDQTLYKSDGWGLYAFQRHILPWIQANRKTVEAASTWSRLLPLLDKVATISKTAANTENAKETKLWTNMQDVRNKVSKLLRENGMAEWVTWVITNTIPTKAYFWNLGNRLAEFYKRRLLAEDSFRQLMAEYLERAKHPPSVFTEAFLENILKTQIIEPLATKLQHQVASGSDTIRWWSGEAGTELISDARKPKHLEFDPARDDMRGASLALREFLAVEVKRDLYRSDQPTTAWRAYAPNKRLERLSDGDISDAATIDSETIASVAIRGAFIEFIHRELPFPLAITLAEYETLASAVQEAWNGTGGGGENMAQSFAEAIHVTLHQFLQYKEPSTFFGFRVGEYDRFLLWSARELLGTDFYTHWHVQPKPRTPALPRKKKKKLFIEYLRQECSVQLMLLSDRENRTNLTLRTDAADHPYWHAIQRVIAYAQWWHKLRQSPFGAKVPSPKTAWRSIKPQDVFASANPKGDDNDGGGGYETFLDFIRGASVDATTTSALLGQVGLQANANSKARKTLAREMLQVCLGKDISTNNIVASTDPYPYPDLNFDALQKASDLIRQYIGQSDTDSWIGVRDVLNDAIEQQARENKPSELLTASPRLVWPLLVSYQLLYAIYENTRTKSAEWSLDRVQYAHAAALMFFYRHVFVRPAESLFLPQIVPQPEGLAVRHDYFSSRALKHFCRDSDYKVQLEALSLEKLQEYLQLVSVETYLLSQTAMPEPDRFARAPVLEFLLEKLLGSTNKRLLVQYDRTAALTRDNTDSYVGKSALVTAAAAATPEAADVAHLETRGMFVFLRTQSDGWYDFSPWIQWSSSATENYRLLKAPSSTTTSESARRLVVYDSLRSSTARTAVLTVEGEQVNIPVGYHAVDKVESPAEKPTTRRSWKEFYGSIQNVNDAELTFLFERSPVSTYLYFVQRWVQIFSNKRASGVSTDLFDETYDAVQGTLDEEKAEAKKLKAELDQVFLSLKDIIAEKKRETYGALSLHAQKLANGAVFQASLGQHINQAFDTFLNQIVETELIAPLAVQLENAENDPIAKAQVLAEASRQALEKAKELDEFTQQLTTESEQTATVLANFSYTRRQQCLNTIANVQNAMENIKKEL